MTKPRRRPAAHRWTPHLAAKRSNASIERAKLAMLAVAREWGDVNNAVVIACDEVRDLLEELSEMVREAVEYELDRTTDG